MNSMNLLPSGWLLFGMTAAEIARTFRLGLTGTVRDRKLGKATVAHECTYFAMKADSHLSEISFLPRVPVWHTGTRYNAGWQDTAENCPAQGAREGGSDRCPAYSLILYKAQTG